MDNNSKEYKEYREYYETIYGTNNNIKEYKKGFSEGYKIALNDNQHKKYTLEQIHKAINFGQKNFDLTPYEMKGKLQDFLDRL